MDYTDCPEWQEDGSCIHSDHMAQAEAGIERMARNLAWQGHHGLTPRELWGDDGAAE